MKTVKRLILSLVAILLLAGIFSVGVVRTKEFSVKKGFYFGLPDGQEAVNADGTYTIKYYGFPSAFREQHIYQSDGDVLGSSTYDMQKFDLLYVVSNFVFWAGLMVALLSPLTIFFRKKNKEYVVLNEQETEDFGLLQKKSIIVNDDEATDVKTQSQAKDLPEKKK